MELHYLDLCAWLLGFLGTFFAVVITLDQVLCIYCWKLVVTSISGLLHRKIWSDKMIQQKNGENAINPPPTAELLSHQVLLQDIIDLTDIRPFPYQFKS